MLRVVLLTPYYFPVVGGVETHARQQARCLKQQGVDVWVLTRVISGDTPREDTVEGIPVRRIGPRGTRSVAGKWLMIPAAIAALIRHRQTFDVIICPDYRGIGLGALIAGRLVHRPVVFQAATPGALSCTNWDPSLSAIGIRPGSLISRLVKRPVQTLYGMADAYACISHEIEDEAGLRVSRRARIRYLPHAVDLEAFRGTDEAGRAHARDALGIERDARVVAYVGRIGREKGALDLVEAWRQLSAGGTGHGDATLLMVGPDMPGHPLDAGPQARALAAQLPAGRVRFAGASDDVRPYLAAADVFVQPSHYEAFGISVIEAMASGLPVVATRVGGMREYLTDGENALLVPPRNPAALAGALSQLLDDPQAAARLGRNGRRTVERQFDEHRIGRQWLDLLVSLTSPGASPAAGVSRAS